MSINVVDENREKFKKKRKKNFKRHVDHLLLIEKNSQSHYVLINDFNTFM